jgi:tetrahydromethanopterin S-methyltransferase subunit B
MEYADVIASVTGASVFMVAAAVEVAKDQNVFITVAGSVVVIISTAINVIKMLKFKKLEKLEKSLNELNAKLSPVNPAIEGLETRFDGVETGMETRFNGVETGMETRFNGVETGMETRFDDANTKIETRFDDANTKIETRFDGVNAKIDEAIAEIRESVENASRMTKRGSKGDVATSSFADSLVNELVRRELVRALDRGVDAFVDKMEETSKHAEIATNLRVPYLNYDLDTHVYFLLMEKATDEQKNKLSKYEWNAFPQFSRI